MRIGAATAAVAMCVAGRVARADDGGVRGDLEVGLVIGGARIHDEGGMIAGGTVAAGAGWHRWSLVATAERDTFIPPQDITPHVYRFGWRARYDLPFYDERLGRQGDARCRMSWYFDAGTGEQLVRWEGVGSHRADVALGTGFAWSVYHRASHTPAWGLIMGFAITSAAALPAIDPAGEATRVSAAAGGASGRENSYVFTFGWRFF
jgi:hypothetical protein